MIEKEKVVKYVYAGKNPRAPHGSVYSTQSGVVLGRTPRSADT